MSKLPQINILEAPTKIPVFWLSLHEHLDQLNLARLGIEEVRASHPESTPSNVKAVYMSPWKSHQLSDKFLPLCCLVQEIGMKISIDAFKADLSSLNFDLVTTDCWGIIYETSDHTIPHMHYPSDLSAVVYLEAEEDAAPIIFGDGLMVKPQPGLLVMFPGILLHQVPANHARRVAVAMNLQKLPKFK